MFVLLPLLHVSHSICLNMTLTEHLSLFIFRRNGNLRRILTADCTVSKLYSPTYQITSLLSYLQLLQVTETQVGRTFFALQHFC